MRVAFLANSFHLSKTKSSLFFINLLKDLFGDVTIIPHKEVWMEITKCSWDIIVVWQHFYKPKELESFNAKNIVLVPMYDDTPFNKEFWENYRSFKVLCFSYKLEKILKEYNLTTFGCHYFPNPNAFPVIKSYNNLNAFFWPRTNSINWLVIKKLIGKTNFNNIHLHLTPDIHNDVSFNITDNDFKHYSISTSSWFYDSNEYINTVIQSNVFFAPRSLEGIGMSFLEAMAMGLCVVAPDFPTMNEYITHGINGLLYDPKNPSPLDFSKVEELGKAARKTVENGWVYWNKIRNDLFVFLSEPLPQCHYNRIHPLIIIKGKSIGYLRKLFRLFKNIF